MSPMSLIALFVDVDDFCYSFRAFLDSRRLGTSTGRRGPKCRLSLSEVMTLIVYFHQSNYRTFKAFYTDYVQVHLRDEFPDPVSYNRFGE